MKRRNIIKTGLAALVIGVAQQSAALTMYAVSSTPNVNCGHAPHGLWTNSYANSSCNEYYNFGAGSTLTVDGVTAVLKATALNAVGNTATINITFAGFEETYQHYKNGGTPDYNGTDTPYNWDFYSYISSGQIVFSNSDVFTAQLVGQINSTTASSNKPVLQIGDGANDKSAGFGASAWLDIYGTGGSADYTGPSHWDLNMSLTAFASDPAIAVPAPAPLALLGIGVLGIFATRRRRR